MKAYISILFFTWFFNLFLPWWSVLIPSIIFGAWLIDRSFNAFVIGFTAAGSAWLLQALIIDVANSAVLSTRIAETFSLPHPLFLLFITFLIGGMLGGAGSLFGYHFKNTFRPAPDSL